MFRFYTALYLFFLRCGNSLGEGQIVLRKAKTQFELWPPFFEKSPTKNNWSQNQ